MTAQDRCNGWTAGNAADYSKMPARGGKNDESAFSNDCRTLRNFGVSRFYRSAPSGRRCRIVYRKSLYSIGLLQRIILQVFLSLDSAIAVIGQGKCRKKPSPWRVVGVKLNFCNLSERQGIN